MRRVPWIAAGTLALALGIRLASLLAPVSGLLPGCAFKRITGAACLTCGLTRCVLALGQGRWAEAFHWHPSAVILLAALPLASVWDLHRAWRRAPYPALPAHPAFRIGVWILLLGAWALQMARGI